MNLFITGASGFLGGAVLSRIGDMSRYDKIYCLVRPTSKKTGAERIKDIALELFPPHQQQEILSKLVAVEGDLTKSHLGLSVRDRWKILDQVHQFLHIGASTDFGAPLKESREYNVDGTRRVLELAEACSRQGALNRFDYISTAFVSGRKRGVVTENTLSRNQAFSNNYEQSKYEAELLVRDYRSRFNIAIHRPSIVVGDSKSGYTPHFKVLYWPLKLLAKGLLPIVPCKRSARMDVVPVDFVADSIVAIMGDPKSVGETWHITAGKGNEVRLDSLLDDAEVFAGIKRVPLIPMWIFNTLMKTPLKNSLGDDFWRAADLASPYEAYLKGTGVRFDSQKTHKYLATRGVELPDWHEYKENVFGFIRESRWGKRLERRPYTYFQKSKTKTKNLINC